MFRGSAKGSESAIFNCQWAIDNGQLKIEDPSYRMKKIKYYYNTHSLRYEKLVTPLRVKLLRVFGFIAAALVTSVIISYFAFQFVGSPTEKILQV